MAEIILSTLNAKYAHASLGLRYLYANLGELQGRAEIREFVWNERTIDLVEGLLAEEPRIVGLGVYIWNARESLALVRMLKAVRPELVVVVGGPEVSYECDEQEICELADYTICGEGDWAFRDLARAVLAGEAPERRLIEGGTPPVAELASPYAYYDDEDIAHRTVYVEASRGCPFKCEFCLSSLDLAVRQFPLEGFLEDMQRLLDRGVRQFKFIDRTFNLSPRISSQILEFFLERMELGLFVHFEMVPDRLPRKLRELIARYPAGSLQFEIGIQTFDPGTMERISRKQDLDRTEENFRFLHEETQVHVHADLIIGLPGEGIESFGRGFDRLVHMGSSEVQVGILKRLRGTTIVRHDEEYQMVYGAEPPYEILQNRDLSFEELASLKRFARAWDLVANRGNFKASLHLIWGEGSPFEGFYAFSRWLFARVGHFKGIALDRLFRLVFDYLVEARGLSELEAARHLAADYMRSRNRLPPFLLEHVDAEDFPPARKRASAAPKRQARHIH